eukprot:scaffold2048_cov294-Amphora_coffeaeformis.AAC.1
MIHTGSIPGVATLSCRSSSASGMMGALVVDVVLLRRLVVRWVTVRAGRLELAYWAVELSEDNVSWLTHISSIRMGGVICHNGSVVVVMMHNHPIVGSFGTAVWPSQGIVIAYGKTVMPRQGIVVAMGPTVWA